jgi:hypothetical protein
VRLVEAVPGELLHLVEEDSRARAGVSPRSSAPFVKIARCFAISSGFFLPMARRSRSAPPSV